MKIKVGDYVKTPRFLTVKIKEVYPSVSAMEADGYTEPTHFKGDVYEIGGKVIGTNRMVFAAAKKKQPM